MIIYFDCSSGISGDMVLGALVDAGLPVQKLQKELRRLPVKGYKLSVKKVKRAGFAATKVDVKLQGSGVRGQGSAKRTWKDIEKLIKKSSLSGDIKKNGLAVFKNLFKAEAKVHGKRYDTVHLHELGAVDCIVDIFGVLIGLDILGIKKVYSSPVNLGSGTIKTKHGILPVPAPATVELLKGIPVYADDSGIELTTPTGAVIISSLAFDVGLMPDMQVSKVGVGAGGREVKSKPNVLRVFIGQSTELRTQSTDSKTTIIETNIDDMNPQIYEHVMNKLLKAGALDVFLTQVLMKKGRPGVMLTTLCSEDKREALIRLILSETTTIGLRFYEVQRRTLAREIKYLKTKYGKIRIKVSKLGGKIINRSPEYEDCRKIADKFDIPLIDVYKEVASLASSARRASSPEKSGSPLRYDK